MVDMLTEELEISVEGGDTTTHKRQDLDKGAEPDKCYWFGDNARRMRGKRQLDLNRDPAPDLVIEVDVTRTSLDRLKIFAAMGVPEVWRSTGRSLQFLHLQADGTYQARTTSRNFPTLHGLIGRSIPQAGADRRLDGLDPVIPGLRPREDRSRPATERTLIDREAGIENERSVTIDLGQHRIQVSKSGLIRRDDCNGRTI